MAKLKPNEKRVQLSFQRPDDLALFSFLSGRAYERRYDLPTFILLSLHEAFEGQYGSAPEPPIMSGEPINLEPYRPSAIGPNPAIIVEDAPPPPKPAASEDIEYEKLQEEIRQTQTKFRGKLKSGRHAIPVPGIGLEPPTDASK